MPELVIAIDPGHRTGWAGAKMSENRIEWLEHGVRSCAEMGDWFYGQQRYPVTRFDVLVYETWRPRPQNGSMAWIQGNELIEVQLIGDLRATARRSGAKIKSYGPNRKRAFTASMPAAIKDRFAHSHEQHDQDALMHLWGYALENWVTDPGKVEVS